MFTIEATGKFARPTAASLSIAAINTVLAVASVWSTTVLFN